MWTVVRIYWSSKIHMVQESWTYLWLLVILAFNICIELRWSNWASKLRWQIRNKFGMTLIFVDIHRNSTENEALKISHHWLQWEQNLLTSSHMAKFNDLPAGWLDSNRSTCKREWNLFNHFSSLIPIQAGFCHSQNTWITKLLTINRLDTVIICFMHDYTPCLFIVHIVREAGCNSSELPSLR